MSKTISASKREQVGAVLCAAERNRQLMSQNPGLLEPYRGEWVVIHEGKVLAHSRDGSGLAEAAPPDKYPGALLERVPTHEELNGVLVV